MPVNEAVTYIVAGSRVPVVPAAGVYVAPPRSVSMWVTTWGGMLLAMMV